MRRRLFDCCAALCAAFLSWLYIEEVLHGGPRIIDATAYWLEARTISDGALSFPIGDPETSWLGRFILRTDGGATVIFPPGYPVVLALGFAVGAPMAVGPLIAAALVLVSAELARVVAARAQLSSGETIARATALLSASCAALRYHTADTMSHGLAALCFAGALCAALHALPPNAPARPSCALISGVAAGWLVATRPVTGLVAFVGLVALASVHKPNRRAIAMFVLGSLPGIALWCAFQHHATGSVLASAQGQYYAISDGPPGCFRYGFGDGVGCLGEHGDFVRHNLQKGYGAYAATATTLRRLKMHLADPLNAAPLFGLVLIGAWIMRRSPVLRWLTALLLLQVLAYAPFYFDGNYPGGGARMFADVLPLEHVLIACGVAAVIRRRYTMAVALGLPVAGWMLHGASEHRLLTEREGGYPMFAGGKEGLVFVDTDHAFNLAYDPARPGWVARRKGDGLDRLVWEERGRPAAYEHRYRWTEAPNSGRVTWLPIEFDKAPTASLPLRIEGESLWPPRMQQGGWAWPSHTSRAGVSAGHWLVLSATTAVASVRVALPARWLGARDMSLHACRIHEDSTLIFTIYIDGKATGQHAMSAPAAGPCGHVGPIALPEHLTQLELELRSTGAVAFDHVMFSKKR